MQLKTFSLISIFHEIIFFLFNYFVIMQLNIFSCNDFISHSVVGNGRLQSQRAWASSLLLVLLCFHEQPVDSYSWPPSVAGMLSPVHRAGHSR